MSIEEELEAKAVTQFKMISSGEANIRKKAGIFFGILSIILIAIGYENLPALSIVIGIAIGTYRTGSENF